MESPPIAFPHTLANQISLVIANALLSASEKTVAILNLLVGHDATKPSTLDWAHNIVTGIYAHEIDSLSSKSSGLHCSASNLHESQLKAFDVDDLANTMQSAAPYVWSLFDSLFLADEKLVKERNRFRMASARSVRPERSMDGDIEMSDVTTLDNPSVDVGGGDVQPEQDRNRAEDRSDKQTIIRKVVALSMMLQSTNQNCNALQTVIGVFLESCNCPETLRELLSRIGLSISTSSINNAIDNLSAEAEQAMKLLLEGLLALLAYDNIDIDLKHSVPTVETSDTTLVHLTSGTLIPLHHGVTLDDLSCSEELWKKAPINPENMLPSSLPTPKISLKQILNIHPNTLDGNGLGRHERFGAWKFLHDLINHGPSYFRQFKSVLGDPEPIDCIPVEKTTQIPCRTLNIHPSSPAQNAEAVESFLRQGGLGEKDPEDPSTSHLQDPGNHVILVSGDLLSAERIRSAMKSRATEDTPWKRMQYIVFVMGLFHLKMAAADAIWRIFIHPTGKTKVDKGQNSLMDFVSKLRPKETGKIESKPGFRRMHEVIQHTGISLRLDCWRIGATEDNSAISSLEEFAASKPSWESIRAIANRLSVKYANNHELSWERNKPDSERDMQHENVLLMHKYFMLYEELSHGMNHGDIGRVECCMIPWMFIFLGCGKHKYGAELRRYLENVHFVYPEGLKKAIRMNILCNPTGKKGAFRAIDWLVELNNLYTKRIYGGKYSNHQLERIIKQSPLIEMFKNIRLQLEKTFCLEHKTSRHSPPDMVATFHKLTTYMEEKNSNLCVPGDPSRRAIPTTDASGIGMQASMMEKTAQEGDGDMGLVEIELEDLEVEDDGSLDI